MSTKTHSVVTERFAENLRRCMDIAGVDVAELARRTDVPTKRVKGILGATIEVSMTELVLFAVALDVEPSAMLPR